MRWKKLGIQVPEAVAERYRRTAKGAGQLRYHATGALLVWLGMSDAQRDAVVRLIAADDATGGKGPSPEQARAAVK